VGDTEAWGVTSDHRIWKIPADGSGSWTLIQGKLKQVSVGARWVWGVGDDGYAYKCQRPCTGSWSWVLGWGGVPLTQIDVGYTEAWGVTKDHRIWKIPADASGSWTRIPGQLKHVSVGARWVWGVAPNDYIYKWRASTWYGMQMQPDVGNTDVEGVNSTHMIYP